MLQPSYSELMDRLNQYNSGQNQINSRYSIVIVVSKRARQINNKENILEGTNKNEKPVSIAIDELYNGKIKIIAGQEQKSNLDNKNDTSAQEKKAHE